MNVSPPVALGAFDASIEFGQSFSQCSPTVQADIISFMAHIQENEPPKDLVSRRLIDEKLDFIQQILDQVPPKESLVLKSIHFAVLLHMPKTCLECYANHVELDLGSVLLDIENLVQRRFSDLKARPIIPSPESQKCHEYDNKLCIITGFGGSAPYNIFAFNPNAELASRYPYNFQLIEQLLGFYHPPPDPFYPCGLDRLQEELRTPNSYWNMITMSPNLGQMWASGLFALKWITNREIFDSSHLRTGKSRIKLHFVWMPCNSHRRRQSSILQLEEAYNLVAELQHQWGREAPPFACTIPDCSDCKSTKAFSAHNCDTGRPIRSGDIFYIIRDTVDLLPCRFAFDIQWALSYAYAVSGQ